MSAVHWLVGTFDFDGDGGLAFLADGDLFVVAFDGLAGFKMLALGEAEWKGCCAKLTLCPY